MATRGRKPGRRLASPRVDLQPEIRQVAGVEEEDEELPGPRIIPKGGKCRKEQAKSGDPDVRRRGYVRLGRRWTQIMQEIDEGMYTWDDIVEEMDNEELSRGQFRSTNGKFLGRPPSILPKAFYDALVRGVKRRFDEKLQSSVLSAVDELVRLGLSDNVRPGDKTKILTYLIDRVYGSAPKRVEVGFADPWQTIVDGIISTPEDSTAPRESPEMYRRRLEPQNSEPGELE